MSNISGKQNLDKYREMNGKRAGLFSDVVWWRTHACVRNGYQNPPRPDPKTSGPRVGQKVCPTLQQHKIPENKIRRTFTESVVVLQTNILDIQHKIKINNFCSSHFVFICFANFGANSPGPADIVRPDSPAFFALRRQSRTIL